jgi:hypothetical protein
MPHSDEKPPIDSRLVGLLIVAAIVLVIILVRWGRYIPWGAR